MYEWIVPFFHKRCKSGYEVAEAHDRIGTATGLAWTETGGESIFIEATIPDEVKKGITILTTDNIDDIVEILLK